MAPLATQLLSALRVALRDAPTGATQLRVDSTAAGPVVLRLVAPTGDLVVCTVAQRAPAPRKGQLALPFGGAPADTAAPAPLLPSATVAEPEVRVSIAEAKWDALDDTARGLLSETHRGHEIDWQGAVGFVTALVPADALAALRGACEGYGVTLHEGALPPEPPSATVAEPADDRGADLGEDGDEFPDGEPYATLSVPRNLVRRYADALGDIALWQADPDGDDGTLFRVVSRAQYDAIGAATVAIPQHLWAAVVVQVLAVDAVAAAVDAATREEAPAPETKPAKKSRASKKAAPDAPPAATLYRDQPHPIADAARAAIASRGDVIVSVLPDSTTSSLARGVRESDVSWIARRDFRREVEHMGHTGTVHRIYHGDRCTWDSREGGQP